MPRTTPSEKIQTRAARARLPLRRKPHWLCLRPGQVHLGYVHRHEAQAGHWTVRRYNGGGAYKVTRLPGLADDFEPANGVDVVSFGQAHDLALRATPQAQTGAPMTVAQALTDYVDYLQTSGREGAAVTAARAGRLHVLPQLGVVPVQALTTDQLRHWLAALATGLAKLINAAEGDFRHLVQAALQTGARYSKLTRLKVHDFDEASGTVGIAKSKAGKPRRVYLTEEGCAFFQALTAFRHGRSHRRYCFFFCCPGAEDFAACSLNNFVLHV